MKVPVHCNVQFMTEESVTKLPEKNTVPGDDQHDKIDYSAARRNLLKLGVAGMPMVLTLKASARQLAISQLQCVIVLPSRIRILVDSDGNAWSGTRNIEYDASKGGYKISDIERFKSHRNTREFTGGLPNSLIPTSCPSYSYYGNDDCSSDDDDDDYDYDDYDSFDNASSDMDVLMQNASVSYSDGLGGGSSDDDDDDDDGCEAPTHTDCGYYFTTLNRNTEIRPADFLDGNTWNLQGDEGLYVALSLQYACGVGSTGWPGISCIVSILTYVQQNGGSGACPPY